jgi:hypothetical protein
MKKRQQQTSVFITDSGGMTPASIFILIGCPLVLSGQYRYGGVSITLGIVLAIISSMNNINEEEKLEIRYNVLSAEDLIAELEQLDCDDDDDVDDGHVDENNNAAGQDRSRDKKRTIDATTTPSSTANETHAAEKRFKYLEGLSALARKYNRSTDRKHELAMCCQQIAFTTIRLYPEDDEVIAGSISLLALIARNTDVRKRYKYQADDYGLGRPIGVLQKALERAKIEVDETKEELLAEILRKGCLFLGAVCNDDKELGLALKVTEVGGLELVLDAASWFRLHEDVSNWALWAVFTLCFDQTRIKMELVRLQGIQTICEIMKNNPTSLEVNRHGVALLFDLLRENQTDGGLKWDPWEIRKVALASGMHNVVFSAMNEFSDSMDIMMMGQEMLVGTGFQGDIPVYQQM